MTNFVKDNFDRYATSYDKNAVVQKVMADELFRILTKIDNNFKTILEIGCGTGYLSQILKKNLKYKKLILNDISNNMIDIVAKSINDSDTSYITGNFEDTQINGRYSLVASNATFQWFTNLDKSFSKIHKILEDSGLLLFSIFVDGTFWELDNSFKLAYNDLNIPYQKMTLNFKSSNEVLDMLKKNKFEIVNFADREYKYYFNHPKDFLKEVRDIGAKVSHNNQTKVGIMRRMFEHYIKNYKDNQNKVVATYKVLYCVCRKQNN